jgi:hypothetical protein
MSEPIQPAEIEPLPEAPPVHWFHKVSAVLFIIFCLELGLFLVIYPWTSEWDTNLFAGILLMKFPRWNEYWLNSYFRGAISGLGLLDLYISIGEIFRLRRFARH